ncbi:UDP-glycosyltransferase 85A2-like [Nymphaea colorata]|uniref:UDP-glycosyltransferase 85A2-like n=1 Tax=Nymphaea colorata TaxID=210225 RepID=UPI00214EFA28|nr:UDP-glycosyltransferase 85A2-like [Nymphaea colorata]
MGRPHVLLLPFPAQGHVKPLMEFAHRLAEEGFMVTFVNTDFIHSRIVKSLPETFTSEYSGSIRLTSIPDGVDSQEDRWNFKEMSNAILHVMPRFLEELILKINEDEKGKITFMIVDGMIGTLLSVAVKLEIRRAVFWPASAWFLAIFKKIPLLLASGTIDENGTLNLSALCLVSEDWSCLDWLDQWPAGSVIYVSLGSTTMLNQRQIDELALGLELTGRPFLWVCRPGVMEKQDALYPEGFMDRITRHGLVVGWAPQQEVLAHPSVACFLTHCGWNSTMEGLSNGVPMLCWPYIGDQFQNQSCIVHIWKVGLSVTQVCDELVTKEEIKSKLEALLSDHGIKERVVELKKHGEMSMIEGGDSFRRFHDFLSVIKVVEKCSAERGASRWPRAEGEIEAIPATAGQLPMPRMAEGVDHGTHVRRVKSREVLGRAWSQQAAKG